MWLVAGPPGPRSREIRRALDAEPGVQLLGEVDAATLDRLYREAMFVATPSMIEGFGYPPLEAMARGVPTLTSDAAALPEVVGDAGPLLPPDDRRRGPERSSGWPKIRVRGELSERGRTRAERFSWPRVADEVVRLYSDIWVADDRMADRRRNVYMLGLGRRGTRSQPRIGGTRGSTRAGGGLGSSTSAKTGSQTTATAT